MNEMDENVFIEALDLLESGLTVDAIVARFPAQAAELRPFLLTAAALGRLAEQPALTAQAQSKRALLAAAGEMAATPTRPVAAGWLRRWLAPALALLLVVLLGGAGLVGASAAAAPGDALYGAKRFIEQTRLNLTADPERAAALREQFRRERVREIERLLADGREAAVSLVGPIEGMDGDRWVVAGVPVRVTVATVIDGAPSVGATAQVDGRTGNDDLVAERIIVLVGGPPDEPTPQPTAASDETMDEETRRTPAAPVEAPGLPPPATITATPTATAPSPTMSPSPTVPPTAAASATPEPQPTAPPSPSPTATPEDDDNGNDNGDDNGNDNSDDNANDNGDDNSNDNGGDNGNDNSDDNANDNGDDNTNDNGDDNANDNGDDNANDNNDDDNANANDDNSGSGGNDNDDNSGSGGDNDNDDG